VKVLVSKKANTDLLSIYSYIEKHNPTAADAILRRIDEKFKQLSELPFIGRERSSLAPGLRSVVVGMHLIFYVVGQDLITIVRVIDGRMDVDEEFRRW
jgi:toxin ParE1/3/4